MQKISGNRSCASCKHQRKRCGADCLLAPYFPAETMPQFRAVQKVFGVGNVSRLLRSIESRERRREAIRSLVWEAEWCRKDPVAGCYGEYLRLRRELDVICMHVYRCTGDRAANVAGSSNRSGITQNISNFMSSNYSSVSVAVNDAAIDPFAGCQTFVNCHSIDGSYSQRGGR